MFLVFMKNMVGVTFIKLFYISTCKVYKKKYKGGSHRASN